MSSCGSRPAASTTPRANMAVNRTPMAVSSRSAWRRVSQPMPRAVTRPATRAPTKVLRPSSRATTSPGSTVWARASPTNAIRRSTT